MCIRDRNYPDVEIILNRTADRTNDGCYQWALDMYTAYPEVEDVYKRQVLECWEAIEDPQVKHNEMVVNFPYTGLGDIPMPGFPVKTSETKGAVYRGAPRVGEHTDEVLREYGYSDADLEALRAQDAIR